MNTKTEIIYTYKSPIEIPPENIHGLQDGSTGKLSIGILDTQDYSYTYISGISGSYKNTFLPLGEDDTTRIISGVSGGTGNMLLQDEPSSLSIDNIKLNARVKRFENLQIQNANLEVMYKFLPPLIITGATLNCQTQTQTLLTNAQLNLRLKKTIRNLPIILGMEFRNPGIHCHEKRYNAGAFRDDDINHDHYSFITVIHDNDGIDLPSFQRSTSARFREDGRYIKGFEPGNAFNHYLFQINTGYRRQLYRGTQYANGSSIIRVFEPFKDINKYTVERQTTNFSWLIYNGLIDRTIHDNGSHKESQNKNNFAAMVCGEKKLFDHSAHYNTVRQAYDAGQWGGVNGRWMSTCRNSCKDAAQQPIISTIFYTTYENYYTNNYAITRTGNSYFSQGANTSFSEILNLTNVTPLTTDINIGEDNMNSSTYQTMQTAVNFYGGDALPKDQNGQLINNRVGGIINFSSLNFVGSQDTISIDSGKTHSFDIKNTLQTFINNNNQELNITSINLNTSGNNFGIYGSVVGSTGTRTLSLINGPSRSAENIPFSTIVNNLAASYPATPISTISVGNQSNYNISYSFNNTNKGSTTIPYTNNVLQVGSVLNNGQAIINTNVNFNIKPFIMNCVSNAGLTGQILTLQNWNKLDDSRINLDVNRIANLSSLLGGKKLYGDPSTYTIGVTGYFDFAGNNEGGGFTGREYMGFTLGCPGSTSIYSIISTSAIGGETYNIDISSFLNSRIDAYSQEIHIPSFNVPPFGDTGYYVDGITSLGITAGQFDQNAVILWNSAKVKIQYNYDLNTLGQYINSSLLADEAGTTATLPIDIINDYPPYVQKSYTISKDITLPLNINDITFVPYSAVTGTPNISRLDLGSTAIGKDFIDLDNASLTINYSYGDSLFSVPFKETFDIGYTLGNFSPSSEKVIPTYLFTKQQRLLTFPSSRFSPSTTLYLVSVRKNQTGYTFNQTPFNWDVYDSALYKNYQIINHEFNGVKNDLAIDKLISLNDYTITRTPGTNLFESIADLESDPPIDINSRTELDDIAQILDNNIDITSIILDPVNSASVPYLHRFFKFDYLNTDKELFLLVSSALTGSTAITAGTSGLYVELNKTNPNPFITSQDDSTYDLSNQLITFDLTNGLTGSDQFKYGDTYLDPSLYGTGATSYLIDVKYKDQHSLEYFGFTGSSSASTLVKGLLPNTTYRINSLTYNIGLTGSKSKIFNFEFQTGVTGIEFSCKSELTQIQNNVLNYNLRLKDLKYVSYPDSIVHQLGVTGPYDLCIDFNDAGVFVDDVSSALTIVTPITYNESGSYIDVSVKGLERGKTYIGKIYLVSKTDRSYLSNRIYTSTIQIPIRSNLALSTSTISSYTYNNTLLKADVYSSDIEKEMSSMNSYNGYLYVMGSTGTIYSKQLIESNGVTYGIFNPITRTIPFEIRNLDPGTTFTNLTLRYNNTNTWLPPSLTGTTSTSTGLIGSTYANNTILQNIPEFTTPAGPTLGLGITGIPNIQIPQFYNSKLDITNFNFYNNDPSNSYPEIYGGNIIVRRQFDNGIIGTKALSSLASYPINIEIYLDKQKLILGTTNQLYISYQWTDFNNTIIDSYTDNNIKLNYSVVISQDQTSLKNYNFTPLFSKVIPSINMNVNKIGDMLLKDLKCDLILKASSTGNFVYRGNFDAGVTYSYKNVIVASGNYYALMGTTFIRNIDPIMDRSWVNITPYLPEGYSFNINNIGQNDNPYLNPSARNNFVYRQVFSATPPIFAGFVYDIVGSTGIDRINYVDFGDRYLKLSYNDGSYDGIFENLLPNQTYNLEYIRSQITLEDNNIIILDSGSTSLGVSNTLMDYIGSESLTGSTSTFFTLKELHYQGSTSYFTDGQIFLNGNTSIGKDIISEGVTFGSTGAQDYLTYQPEISISQLVFDQSSNSNIFYNTLSATAGVTGEKFNKVVLNITNFGLTGSNLDDYFVVKGGTLGSTGSIDYYKEFKLRDYYSDSQTFNNLVIDNLDESTEYSNFKLHYKYAYMNRLSDTFINISSFLTKPGLDVTCTVVSGINNMYATISNVTINDQQRTTLFESDDPSNQFIFYLYKFNEKGVYMDKDQTNYPIITKTKAIPFDVKLPGADQGVVYDKMYFNHTEFIEGTTFSFIRTININ
jgi:hypothetical protein